MPTMQDCSDVVHALFVVVWLTVIAAITAALVLFVAVPAKAQTSSNWIQITPEMRAHELQRKQAEQRYLDENRALRRVIERELARERAERLTETIIREEPFIDPWNKARR